MVITEFFKTREDGVNLNRTIDAVVDENGKPVRDEGGNLIPTGLVIHKIGTEEYYGEAIDVENAPFKYEETTILIEQPEEPIEEENYSKEE